MTSLLSATGGIEQISAEPSVLRVLVFAACPGAEDVAQEIRKRLSAEVEVVTNRASLPDVLQHHTFSVLVVEQSAIPDDPEAAERFYGQMSGALVLEANFALSSAARIAGQIVPALRRRAQASRHLEQVAAEHLRAQFSNSLTGLLLESQLALRQAGPQLAPTLHRIIGLVEHLSEQLCLNTNVL